MNSSVSGKNLEFYQSWVMITNFWNLEKLVLLDYLTMRLFYGYVVDLEKWLC